LIVHATDMRVHRNPDSVDEIESNPLVDEPFGEFGKMENLCVYVNAIRVKIDFPIVIFIMLKWIW